MIQEPTFYLDVFSYLAKNALDDKTKALYRKYLRNNLLVDSHYIDLGRYLHKPPIIINKYKNNLPLFPWYDYNLGLYNNVTSYKPDSSNDVDELGFEWRMDWQTPLGAYNYNSYVDNVGYGFDSGCVIDGVIINNLTVHQTSVQAQELYHYPMTIKIVSWQDFVQYNSNAWAQNIDYTNSTNVEYVNGEIQTMGDGFVKIQFENPIPLGTDGRDGIYVGITAGISNPIQDDEWMYVSGIYPYQKYQLPNPVNHSVSVSPTSFKEEESRTGGQYSYTTRAVNANKLFTQGEMYSYSEDSGYEFQYR